MGVWRWRLWLAQALAWVVVLQLWGTPAPAHALGWRLPARGAPPSARPANGTAPQRLQEVSPPEGVQRLQGVLQERDPRVEILAPADGSLLPDGPWTLRLHVSDWPLVDAGPLGLGPHLVVQLDGQAPRPVVETNVLMPSLSPGSHLLTVYAALPWGEAHKSPSAVRQIRLHRLAPNPATLPAEGTPQLLPVSPVGSVGAPPLLLDWLLLNAPLQGLRTDTLGWRLRITVNGESVLVDRQMPLWLKGWKTGSNALLLELLDGRGDPLNPPFNSLLQEVFVAAPEPAERPPLTALERAVLLGEAPLSALTPAPTPSKEGPAAPPQEPSAAEVPLPPLPTPELQATSDPLPSGVALVEPAQPLPPSPAESPPVAKPMAEPGPEPPEPMPPPALPEEPEAVPTPQPASEGPPGPIGETVSPERAEPSPGAPGAPALPAPASVRPPRAPTEEPQPSSTSSSLVVPAREEVNPDGTLKRPSRTSPLARLRERLQR